MKRLIHVLCGYLLFACLLLASPVKPSAASSVPGYSENQVKAAFITHLFSFIDWPKEAPRYVLCATEDSPLVSVITELVNAKPALSLTVRVMDPADVSQATCHALIVDNRATSGATSVVDIAQIGLLTIGDAPGFAKQGGMIELERRPSRIGLIVNLTATQKAGFQVSSKLLRLATIIESEGA